MDEKLKKFAQQLAGVWNKLDKKKQIGIPIAAAAVIIIIIMVVTALNTTKYELLCSGLTESEAGEVYSAVSAKNVAVKVSGTDIYVQQGQADTVRMQLAEQGMPQGNLPYDLYSSSTNFAETDKDKAIKYLQQTQNRLQNTIETIPGVKQAIVTVAQSDDNTYVLESDKTNTTASVKLTLALGTTLTKTQVKGIVQLVTKGVLGLKAENVTVADSDGNELTSSDEDGIDVTSDQLAMKTRYEASVKSKLVQMLGQIYGQSNVNVVVNADLDFSSKNTVINSVTSGAVGYVTESSEYTANGSGLASGVAGVSGAQPAYPSTSGTGTTAVTSKSGKTTSMITGSVQQQIQKVGGQINKLTVAVILNSHDAAAAGADATALKQTIADAVGTSVNNISVRQMNFSSTIVPISSTAAHSFILPGIDLGANAIYILLAAALLVIVVITLLVVLLSQRKKKREQKAQEALLATAQAEEAQQPNTNERKPIAPIRSIEQTLAESQSNSLKKEIENFTDKKPELVAQILKNWLKD